MIKNKNQIKDNLPKANTIIKNNSNKKNIFFIAIISAIILCLYLPDINYSFTADDDIALVKDNYDFLSKSSNLPNIFNQSVFFNNFKVTDKYYRPILTLSFFYDTQIAGKHYWFFYLTNILLHIACCILLFIILQKLSFDKTKSFFFTLLFAVHPAFAQAIAWLPGRNDTLLTLFSLISFFLLIEYCNRKKIIYYFFNLFFLLVAFLTKESTIFLPLLFVLYILLWRDEKGTILKKISIYKVLLLSWLLLIVISVIDRKSVLGDALGYPISFIISNFITNLPAVIQYIGKIILPFHLNTIPVLQDIPILYGIISILAIIFLIWKSKNKNNKRIIFGILWLLIFLFPAILRTSDTLETLFLEHRLYFPMIGFIIVIMETDIVKKFDFNKKNIQIILIIIIVFFFSLSWLHREDYKDQYHFWKSAAVGSPHSSLALRGFATYYQANGDADKAEKLFIDCLNINPDIAEANNNLGRIYLNRGQDSIAEKYFLKELETYPNEGMAYYNLGCVKYDAKKFPEAIDLIEKSLKFNPDNIDAENYLGCSYFNLGQDSIAEKIFHHAIEIDSTSGMSLYNLGRVKFDTRKFPEAIDLIRKSLKLTPDNIDAENDLSAILAVQGQYEESATLCISVLEKNPKYENARNNLKKIFLIWKEKEKVKYYQDLIQKKGIYLQ